MIDTKKERGEWRMAKFDDFDLDIVVKKQHNIVQPNITSKSLCTPGCITGILMCLTQNIHYQDWGASFYAGVLFKNSKKSMNFLLSFFQ